MKSPHLTAALLTGIFLVTGCSLANPFRSSKAPEDSSLGQPPSVSDADPLTAARQLAWEAAVMVQNPPHPANTWQQAKSKWQRAIALLETASNNATVAAQAKEKLSVYRANYAAIDQRLTAEQTAADSLKSAQNLAWQAAVAVQDPPHPLKVWQTANQQWQAAIALLEKIPKTTSTYAKSQEKLATYRNNYTTINQRVDMETSALMALKQFSEIAVQLNSATTGRGTNSTPDPVGINYGNYDRMVQTMESLLDKLTSQPEGRKNIIYAELAATLEDHKLAHRLWQSYLSFQKDDQEFDATASNQLFPISLQESNLLIRKYGVRTYGNGTQISLKFTVWRIWQRATQHLRLAQEKVLSLK